MSTTATTPGFGKSTAPHTERSPVPALLATLVALAAAVLALLDLFAHGLWPTVLHTAVGLGTFGLVRLCMGLALEPPSPDDLHDEPETIP
ncbi:hypothetical protein AB0G74_16780 [Streptomyces sp. NPDC020875]|uniref:hypothetical protein n=1 Tax=Streptomyces sp. NPDC020875 TaxID=3154898 RepID=UPI0033F7793A